MQFVESAHILPHQCSVVTVKVEGDVCDSQGSLILEPDNLDQDVQVQQSLFMVHKDGIFQTLEIHSGFTQTLDLGIILGTAVEFKEVVSTEGHQASIVSPPAAGE